jgi:ATP-dependent Zn protease
MANSPSVVERLVRNPEVRRALIRKLRGKAPETGPELDLDLLADATPDGASAASAPRSAVASIWQFMVEPVEQTVLLRLQQNALLPIFLLENPYPVYAGSLQEAIAANPTLKKFKLIDIDGKSESELGLHVLALAGAPPEGVLLLCTSKNQLPKNFRSVVRQDGYFSIEPPGFERLQAYAQRHRPQASLSPDCKPWAKWIGPQELLIASTLADAHWESGLRMLADQRAGSQMPGVPRKLSDLYGAESAKSWAQQLFVDIALAREGKISWQEVDRGALLVGPPGTGKTTIARAIALEAGTNFVAVTPVKDWMSGGGLDDAVKLMASTFSMARQQSPSIVFIDEIDSVGNRQNFSGQNASYNTAFLNALLTELDGFEGRDQVVVIAATNYPENVDAALQRSGRLDRIIRVERPNGDALAAMFAGMLQSQGCSLPEPDIRECAVNSLGLTGADVEVLVRGARRRARLDGNRNLRKADILGEIYRIPADSERRPIRNDQLENTAFHEAGHALLGLTLDTLTAQVRIASIIPDNDGALGFVAIGNGEGNETQQSILDRICMALGGRAAEELVYGKGKTSTGAGGAGRQNDLAVARRLAESYVGLYGFGALHPNWWSPAEPALAGEAQDIIKQQFQRALAMLTEQRAQLNQIAAALLHEHVLNRDRLLSFIQPTTEAS